MKVWLKYKTDTGVNFLDKLKLVIRPSIWKYCIACSGQHKSVNLIIDFLLNLLFLNAWNVSWQHFIAFCFFFFLLIFNLVRPFSLYPKVYVWEQKVKYLLFYIMLLWYTYKHKIPWQTPLLFGKHWTQISQQLPHFF